MKNLLPRSDGTVLSSDYLASATIAALMALVLASQVMRLSNVGQPLTFAEHLAAFFCVVLAGTRVFRRKWVGPLFLTASVLAGEFAVPILMGPSLQRLGFSLREHTSTAYSNNCAQTANVAADDNYHLRFCEFIGDVGNSGNGGQVIAFDPQRLIVDQQSCDALEKRANPLYKFPWFQIFAPTHFKCQAITGSYFLISNPA